MSREHENHQPHELTPFGAGLPTPPPGSSTAGLTAELRPVADALAALSPAPPRIDRDRLMFLAGAASAGAASSEPQTLNPEPLTPVKGSGFSVQLSSIWPASTAALGATSLALAIALAVRPAPAERIVVVERPVNVAQDALPAPQLVAPPNHPIRFDADRGALATAATAHNYVRTRDVALRLGLDALGTTPSGGNADRPTPTYGSLLESLVE